MKKALSLLLALVLCLSLCACDENIQDNTDGTENVGNAGDTLTGTEGTTDATTNDNLDKEAKYQEAIESLMIFEEQPEFEAAYYEKIEAVYNMLVALGDYKDAQKYLEYFIVVPNVVLYSEERSIDAFDRETVKLAQMFGYDAKGNQVWKINGGRDVFRYSYNENGLLIESRDNWGDAYTYITTGNYDEQGRVTDRTTVQEDGTTHHTIYQYEDNDSWTVTTDNGTPSYNEAEYNENGQLVKLTQYPQEYLDGIKSHSYTVSLYEYDADGNKIKDQYTRYYVDIKGIGEEATSKTYEAYSSTIVFNYTNGQLTDYESWDSDGDAHHYYYTYGTFYWYISPEA